MWTTTPSARPLAFLGLVVILTACGGGAGTGRERAPGGALWLTGREDSVDVEGLRRLREVGANELFVEAGRFAGGGGAARLERADLPELPAGTAVTLVLRGEAPSPGQDFEAGAQTFAAEIESLRRDAEGRQLLPLGVHLELSGGGDAEHDGALGEWLDALRERLDPGQFLSLGIGRGALERESALEAAGQADFVVAWLYGQTPESDDDPAAWDPERVLAGLDRLEQAEIDHLLGARTVPRIELRGRDGSTRATTTSGSLRTLVERPELERRPDDLFGGAGRIVYRYRARRPAEVFGLSLAAGEEVRVIRTSSGVVQDLFKRVTTRNPRHYLGPVVERLARGGESLAFSLDDVVTALGNAPSAPKLTPRIVVKSRRSDTWVLEVVLANESRQGTDLASMDSNFLQLRVSGGYIGRVVPGDFLRYRFWLKDQEVRPGILGWREPDEVRLYTPLVDGGDTLHAEIEVRTRSSVAALSLGGSFLLPEGRILELDPWHGPLQQIPPR